jgi:ribonuclease HI
MESSLSLEMPDTPTRAWQAVQERLEAAGDDHRDVLFEVSRDLGRLTAATTIHAIWCARLRLRHEPEADQPTLRAVVNATVDNALRDFVLLTYEYDSDKQTAPTRTVTGALAARLTEPPAEPTRTPPVSSRSRYLLFFDGGSRGNPGPGGSGSVMVRVDTDTHATEIIWASSMSYAQADTTNNTAEYWGLIHGLRRAESDRLTPLHVVGDSAMIIQQMRRHRPPRHHRLRQLYLKARRCADSLGICSWTHHYRAQNKMADMAANVAMDSRASQQTCAHENRPLIADLEQHLHNDVQQWLYSTAARGSSLRTSSQSAHGGPGRREE